MNRPANEGSHYAPRLAPGRDHFQSLLNLQQPLDHVIAVVLLPKMDFISSDQESTHLPLIPSKLNLIALALQILR
jgi:hypothetical protein